MANFLGKFPIFRHQGNRGRLSKVWQTPLNVTGIFELADPENHATEPKITTLSYMQPELWQFKDFPIETMLIFSTFHQNSVKYEILF